MTTRTAARATGALLLCVALFLFSGTFGVLASDAKQSGSWSGGGIWVALALVIAVVTYPAAGWLIAARRAGNPIGWLLLAIGVMWGAGFTSTYADYTLKLHHDLPGGAFVAAVGGAFWLPAIGTTGTFLLLLFPDGHLPGRRWRWIAWASAAAIAAALVYLIFRPGSLADAGYPGVQNPLGIDALRPVLAAGWAAILLVIAMMVASAASLVVRYRRARGPERQQVKWLAAAAAGVAAVYAVVVPIGAYVDPSSQDTPTWLSAAQSISLLSFALIPVAIVFAVLRYRLYEIDVIIRRTLVYAVLIAVLAAVYLGGVALTGGLLRTVTGGSGAIGVTVSTLIVAAAFQPLRARIQRAVDRRFYRGRYDAARTLESFSGRLREHIEIETVSGEVLDVVHRTLQPAHVSLWLRSPEADR
jgi:cytochrome b subunit of formate dehydrogenase